MPIQVRPDGPIPARVMIVGEAPGAEEERDGVPFVGASGKELNKMLSEAGMSRGECFVTNVARERPSGNNISEFILSDKNKKPIRSEKPKTSTAGYTRMRDLWVKRPIMEGFDLLRKEIATVKPEIIIPLGNVSMWALTGKWGIMKWRGSMLHADDLANVLLSPISTAPKVIPTIHPAAALREWSFRSTIVQDLRRAAQFRDGRPYPKPEWNFRIRPSFSSACEVLNELIRTLDSGARLRLSFDLETRAGHIACAGISWTLLDAICIPFMCVERQRGYWTEEEEAFLIFLLYRLLTHPLAEIVGQNILYDSQYTWRHWCFVPRVAQDCMISQHAIFSDRPKALAFQASMYCNYYVYWKDEGKNWDKSLGEEQLWYYNCEDCVYTDEGGRVELDVVESWSVEKLTKPALWPKLKEVHTFQQKLFWPVLQAMQRGVLIDQKQRNILIDEVQEEVSRRHQFLIDVLGHPLNPGSNGENGQMQKLFYQDLNQPVIMTRAKAGQPARPTLNDDALQTIAVREPILKPIINCIADIRTMGIFLSSFLRKPLDEDGRMRCSYNIGGSESGASAPKTYRLSSSENAFGSGGNLQNIPSEKSKSVGKAAARGAISGLGDPYSYPNIRSMFIPDPGYIFFDGDLDRADLQVVVWEADDAMLKEALRRGVDIHLLNAFIVAGKNPPSMEELIEGHGKYPDHRGPMKMHREFAKVFCHATNYVGGVRTVAAHTGRTVHEIDRAQKIWFGAHPGIEQWHKRTEDQIVKYRFVENRFGYRWYIFDRIDQILPEAVAWIPQSTVSVVINKIWMNVFENLPEAQVLLQIHDALAGQYHAKHLDMPRRIKEQAQIVIPYEDPLIIPFSVKTSEKSWGDCH